MSKFLTPRILLSIARSVKFGETCHTTPFAWDEGNQKIVLRQAWNRPLAPWKVLTVLAFGYYVYMLGRFGLLLNDSEVKIGSVIRASLTLAFYTFVPFVQYTAVEYADRVPMLFDMFREFLAANEAKMLQTWPSIEKLPKIGACQMFVEAVLVSFPSQCLLAIGAAVYSSNSVESVRPVVRFVLETTFGVSNTCLTTEVVIAALFQTCFFVYFMSYSCLLAVLAGIVVFQAPAALILLCRSSSDLRALRDFFKAHAQLALVLKEFNEIYGVVLAAVEIVSGGLCVIGAYCSIRIGGFPSYAAVGAGIAMLTHMYLVLNACADVDVYSKKKMSRVSHHMPEYTDWDRRKFRSLRSLRIHVGVYYVDKILVLTVTKVVLDSVVNVLLL